jgi:hypothetical protein
MLSTEVKALVGERDLPRGNAINAGSTEVNSLFKSAGILLNMAGKFLFGKRAQTEIQLVDMERVKQMKAAYAAKVVVYAYCMMLTV